jgi:hypothetical protein
MSSQAVTTTSSTISGETVLANLRRLPDIFYIGTTNLAAQAEYRIGGTGGNQLIVKNNDAIPTEFIMAGVFEIDRRDFFFTSDANYHPEKHRDLDKKFESAKATCRLIPVQRDISYQFSAEHFATAINNLRALEKLAATPKDSTIYSTICNIEGGSHGIKLSHALFQVNISPHLFLSTIKILIYILRRKSKPSLTTMMTTMSNLVFITSSNDCILLTRFADTTIESDIDTSTWPVHDRCKGELEQITGTHHVIPIPAFSLKGKRVPPDQYQQRLSGAIVEVRFGMTHHYIKRSKRSVFSAVVRELTILRPPINVINSPIKKRPHPDSGTTDSTSTNKRIRRESDTET